MERADQVLAFGQVKACLAAREASTIDSNVVGTATQSIRAYRLKRRSLPYLQSHRRQSDDCAFTIKPFQEMISINRKWFRGFMFFRGNNDRLWFKTRSCKTASFFKVKHRHVFIVTMIGFCCRTNCQFVLRPHHTRPSQTSDAVPIPPAHDARFVPQFFHPRMIRGKNCNGRRALQVRVFFSADHPPAKGGYPTLC